MVFDHQKFAGRASWSVLFVALTQSTFALAQASPSVCTNSRPGWNPEDGDVTMIGEALFLLTTPGVITLLVAMVLAVRFRNFWFTLSITGIAAVVSYFFHDTWVNAPANSLPAKSILEGCVGSPYLGIAVLLGSAILVLGWHFLGPKRENETGASS